jgi:hypothetical protein
VRNLQADGLSDALLRSLNPKLYLIAFEPLMLKKSEAKGLKEGDLITLGKKLPQLYIYRKGGVVGQVVLGEVDGREAVIISAKERITNLGKAKPKYTTLVCRIAVLPKREFIVGKLVYIPAHSTEKILIFVKETVVARAKLVENGEIFFLQITERY